MAANSGKRTRSGQPKLTKYEILGRVRSNDTALELRFRKTLWAEGLRYRLRLKLPGSPDLVFLRARLVVFIDGCFWHGCPEHYRRPPTNVDFWRQKVERNMARDRRVDQELAELGWAVLRVWEHEITKDLPGAVARTVEAVCGPGVMRRKGGRSGSRAPPRVYRWLKGASDAATLSISS
jgi:DNA mismatch endonuclease, patch repair protein